MYSNRTLISICMMAGALCVTERSYADAAFLPYEAIATGSWPEAVAIGDVNGDGRNDVVLTTSFYFDPDNDYKLFVFIQDASGALSPPVRYPTQGGYGYSPETVDIGDVNNDGLNDVIVGNTGTTIEVFYQDSSGALSAGTTISTPYSLRVRAGDLNGDGLTDVAGIGWSGNEVGVFLQDSSGSLALSGAYYAPHGGYDDLELGDVNSDGLTDIIVMSGQGFEDNLAVLTQDGAGSFNPVAYYDLGGDELTHGVGVGDVTGDNKSDVVVSYGGNRPSSSIAVFPQLSDGTLDMPASMPSLDLPTALDIADVTNDGRSDVIVLHSDLNGLGVYTQEQDGSLSTESYFPVPNSVLNPHGLAVGDINGDGAADVVIADYSSGLVTVINANPLPSNLAPVADAGDDQTVRQRRTVHLDGTASTDSDGTIVSYEWTQISGRRVTLYPTSTPGIVQFRAPRSRRYSANELVFELKVTDDDGASSTDQVTITVTR